MITVSSSGSGPYGPLTPETEYTFSGDQLDAPTAVKKPCNGWQGGNPTLPGWRLYVQYKTRDREDTLQLASGPGFINYSSDNPALGALSCDLDGHVLNGIRGSLAQKLFACEWSNN